MHGEQPIEAVVLGLHATSYCCLISNQDDPKFVSTTIRWPSWLSLNWHLQINRSDSMEHRTDFRDHSLHPRDGV